MKHAKKTCAGGDVLACSNTAELVP